MAKKKAKKKTVKKVSKPKIKKSAKKVVKGKAKKNKGKAVVFLSLGSNVGDREEYIEQAIFLLEKNPNIHVVKHSSNIETEPEGKAGQAMFLNSALELTTTLSPIQLLDACQEIETALGREREIEWGPRTIDIDILMYDDEIYSDERLQIPHPLMHERMFVLRPLREIAPHLKHPVLDKAIDDLYDEKKTDMGDKYDDELPGFREIHGGQYDDYEKW